MAVEEAHEQAEGEGGGHKKAKPKLAMLAVVGAVVVALVGVGGYYAASKLGKGRAGEAKGEPAKEEQAKEPKGGEGGGEEGKKAGVGNIVSLDPIIVNLSGDEGRRFLKLTMQFEVATAGGAAEVQGKMPQIKDAVITIISSKTAEDLLTPEGKFRLKEQVATRVNSALANGAVKNVFFAEFIIQ